MNKTTEYCSYHYLKGKSFQNPNFAFVLNLSHLELENSDSHPISHVGIVFQFSFFPNDSISFDLVSNIVESIFYQFSSTIRSGKHDTLFQHTN